MAALLAPRSGPATTPNTVGITGHLSAANGAPVADGSYLTTFRLYATANAKQALFTEVIKNVAVQAGRFKVALGAASKLDDKTLNAVGWIGVQVANEPEMARVALRSAPFALRAHRAAGLQCSGCLSTSALLGDGDLVLGGNALKAKQVVAGSVIAGSVSAQSLAGDGSKLTGVVPPAESCAKGQSVIGVQADGKLKCIAGGGLPDDALAAVSGGLLTTTWSDTIASVNTPKPIQDNNPIGTIDEINVPDVGLIKQISVTVKLTNSDLTGLEVRLYDPANAEYVLHKGKAGKVLDETWPVTTKTVSGDLTKWIGKNPKGKWRLRLIDSKFLNNGNDGALQTFALNVSVKATNLVTSKGAFAAAGSFGVQNSAGAPYACTAKVLGGQYFDTKTMRMYYCDGEWRELLVESLCGNKIINSTETCDDGNVKDGDGCTAKCQKNFCGDGVVWVGKEQCDDGNKVDGDACSNQCVAKWKGITFTNCGKSDRTGPSQNQCDSAYGPGKVKVSGGIQAWTVPFSGVFRIEAWGAKGGGTAGANGARVRGDFVLKAGEVIHIIVGQMGLVTTQGPKYGAGGGGGTWIYRKATDPLPLLIAAGGGGQSEYGCSKAVSGGVGSATKTTTLGKGSGSANGGSGGNGGLGGKKVGNYSTGGGGAGWLSNGKDGLHLRNPKGLGGKAPRFGAQGGPPTHNSGFKGGSGGFGGGGGMSDNTGAGGGGGGFNGGGGGNNYLGSCKWGSGGGGGSYNGGAKQNGSSGANSSHGKIVITPG